MTKSMGSFALSTRVLTVAYLRLGALIFQEWYPNKAEVTAVLSVL